jgi:hypothetical protein
MIATPHSTHADLVVAAAEAGKHIFVDKPFTLSVAEAKRASAAADRAGVVLQVGHNRRRQPATRRLKQLAASWGWSTTRKPICPTPKGSTLEPAGVVIRPKAPQAG